MVARLLGVHAETIRRRIKSGQLPGGRDNRGNFYVEMSAEDVAALERRTPSPAGATVGADVATRDETIRVLEAQVADLQRERDRLLDMLERCQSAGWLSWLRQLFSRR